MSGHRAGCPGIGPDVRAFMRRRMSGRWGRMSGLVELALRLSRWMDPGVRAEGPDVCDFGRRRMYGANAGRPGCRGKLLCSLDTSAGCPGFRLDFRWGPDVRAGRRMSGPRSFFCRGLAM